MSVTSSTLSPSADAFHAFAQEWLLKFEQALAAQDFAGLHALFVPDCFWRDLLAFTWTIRTMEGPEAIRAMLRATLAHTKPSTWAIEGMASETGGIGEAWFHFETALGRARGMVRFKDGRAWTILTTLQELKGFEEPSGTRRDKGVEHKVVRGRTTWLEQRAREEASLGTTTQPYCLIVGGGQGGIGLAARLKRLGVPSLVIDRLDKPGDAWRRRYKTLCLHDPVWYDHLPYIPFPDHWPVFTPKDKMGDWLEMYVKVMELNYWSRSDCLGASHDPRANGGAGEWTVKVSRDGVEHVLRPTQLVLATGMSGLPQVPQFPGAETFKGEQMHSSGFASGEAYRGKQCVVVGANNSAHDICVNLWENEAEVTMVQRSSTMVARSETLLEVGWGRYFSENALKNGYTPERADLALAAAPYKVITEASREVWTKAALRDASFYDGLRQAGFRLNFGEDGTGIGLLYLRRGAGYYIDVGGSELVANGDIRLKSGVGVERLTAHSVIFTDGSELPADLVVYATGYGSMEGWAAKIVSPEVAERVGKCWGIGSATSHDPGPWTGELRNMWKPTAQPGLWFHGGNLQQSRSYSLYLGLQIKARMEGLNVAVYDLPDPALPR
jgi:putative flavoprotein involved in K+ transport